MVPVTPEEMLVRGWSVIPVRADKRPAIKSWKEFQRTRPSVAQVRDWAKKLRPRAWAVVCGLISGLIVLDFDGDAGNLLIPMKVITDSDLIPVTCSDAIPITVGAKRRWRPYGA
jgi:hypothetical protein